jgi:DNA-directed RNA polymerase specialized sigma24 family protein
VLGESERSLLIRSALESVRDGTDREVIRLHFFEQLALPAIAERLGLSYDQAREGYRRGLRQLEHHLHPLKPGLED